MAGLWETWKSPAGETVLSFTIITTEPNAFVGEILNRIPAILTEVDWPAWLGETGDETYARATADDRFAIPEGAHWSDVVEINSYHVGLVDQAEAVLKVAAEFLEDPYPAWTAVGVTELILPEALVEISCAAVVSTDPA